MTVRRLWSVITASAMPAAIIVIAGLALWEPTKYYLADLLLRIGGVHTPGKILSAWEDVEDADDGRAVWYHTVTYSFQTNTGRTIRGIESGNGRLREDLVSISEPVPVLVEYLPRYPHVSRLRASPSLGSWWSLVLRGIAGVIGWGFLLRIAAKLFGPILKSAQTSLANDPSG